ncbi:MAG: NAD-dependent epimerase/dehydratase family protein, partial [Candidatus Aminicenantes bacterium]|nr:NAD-dependent epimerase/dehydratase family protein [Candidatus Aminicenantes bacterium]
MNCLVTGAAGFIGSHLTERLLNDGFSVIGIDSFNDTYSRWMKDEHILPFKNNSQFQLISDNLNDIDLSSLLQDVDYIFHMAAQAGVRSSWGKHFSVYTENNISATQKLLEAAKDSSIKKLIYASSSSVYGLCPELPMIESSPLLPYSPYGVTKLAAENLCQLYYKNFCVPTVSLRFFTVYGPGQRPDMAFHIFLKSMNENKPIPLYGDGKQTRDFTYIDDIIDANVHSMDQGQAGEVYNVGGGNRKEMKAIFPILEKITGKKVLLQHFDQQKGDVFHTYAGINKAKKDLDFHPQIPLEEGLTQEW